jgi:hypothetical protein
MRNANADYVLKAFRAIAGNTVSSDQTGVADICVLVDGRMRWRRRAINAFHGALKISVPLNRDDQFLTLAITDGNDGINSDWLLFGDPRIELSPKQ